MFSNVDVLTPDKLRELKTRVQDNNVKPSIIALQEVRPKNYRYDRLLVEYSIDEYEMVGKNISNAEEGRGLLIYVHKSVTFTEITFGQQYCEYLSIEVKGMNGSVLITSIYRSPSGDVTENEKLMELMREVNNNQARYKVILGDFNMPNINWILSTTTGGWNSIEYKFIETVRDCFLTQHIKDITRYRGGVRGSVIDLVFSNDEEIVEDVEIESPIGRSDHACITFTCNVSTQKTTCKTKIYMYERADYGLMKQRLNINWREYLGETDVEDMWSKFTTKLDEVIKEWGWGSLELG